MAPSSPTPDLVVMCVEENRREDADALTAAGIATAALSIDTVADVGPALPCWPAWWAYRPGGGGPAARSRAPTAAGVRPHLEAPVDDLSGGTYGSSLLARSASPTCSPAPPTATRR